VRSLRIGPLLVAIAICVLFALFGSALVGESLGNWYGTLDKPSFLVPLWVFYIVGAVYYVLFVTVLYRILTRVDDCRGRATSLALTICVLFLNELWNYGLFGLESTLLGFLDIACSWCPLQRCSSRAAHTNGSRRGWSPSTGYGYSTTSPGHSRCGG
jgi:tryptophan-rich sensory protein